MFFFSKENEKTIQELSLLIKKEKLIREDGVKISEKQKKLNILICAMKIENVIYFISFQPTRILSFYLVKKVISLIKQKKTKQKDILNTICFYCYSKHQQDYKMSISRNSQNESEMQIMTQDFKIYLCSNSKDRQQVSEKKISNASNQSSQQCIQEFKIQYSLPNYEQDSSGRNQQFPYDNFIFIEEVSHYNQINNLKEEDFKNFYSKKLQIVFNSQWNGEISDFDLQIIGVLASLMILNLRFQLSSDTINIFKKIQIQKLKISNNVYEKLTEILFQQKKMQNTGINEIIKILSSRQGYEEVLSFFTQNMENKIKQNISDEFEMQRVLQYLSKSYKVYIRTQDNTLYNCNERSSSEEQDEQNQNQKILPLIFLNKIDNGVEIYYTQPFYNIIIENQFEQNQFDRQIFQISGIRQILFANDSDYENFNFENDFSGYMITNNPLEGIIFQTFVNLIEEILKVSKSDLKKIELLFKKFRDPFDQDEEEINSSQLKKSESFSGISQNKYQKDLDQFYKGLNINEGKKLNDKSIKQIGDILKKFKDNQNLMQVVYKYVKNKLFQNSEKSFTSKNIREIIEKEYYNNILPIKTFPSWIIDSQRTFILIPKIEKEQRSCGQSCCNICQKIWNFLTCKLFRKSKQEVGDTDNQGIQQKQPLQQKLIDKKQQKNDSAGNSKFQSHSFIFIFDYDTYKEGQEQQIKRVKAQSNQYNSKRNTSSEYDQSGSQIFLQKSPNQNLKPQNNSRQILQQNLLQTDRFQPFLEQQNILGPSSPINQQQNQQQMEDKQQTDIFKFEEQNFQQDEIQVQQQSQIKQNQQPIQQEQPIQQQNPDFNLNQNNQQEENKLEQQDNKITEEQMIEQMQQNQKEFEENLQKQLTFFNKQNQNYPVCKCGKIQDVFYEGYQVCQNCLIKQFFSNC